MDPLEFYNYLQKSDIEFFTGIPDSLLKELNNVIQKNTITNNHIITANEGSSIALATGYHLATKKIPLVYLQNSGTGNTINPLMSLVSEKVYSIPILIIIGWRGEPGVKDEPQHLSQGECMTNLITSLNLTYDILPTNLTDAKIIINRSLDIIKTKSKPHIILVKKNTFLKYNDKINVLNNYPIYRKEALEDIIKYFKNDLILSTTGKSSRELLESMKDLGLSQDNIFLNVGAMGHVSMIALGVAMNTPKRVICIDGDGSVIMHMGNLTNIGTSNCSNLIHIVLNNGMHESVGIQPTNAYNINLSNIAENCGYCYSKVIDTKESLLESLDEITNNSYTSPVFLEIRINNKVNYQHELTRPTDTPIDRKHQFIKCIKT